MSVTSSNAKSSYRPEIDGLRALAVIAVILNHYGQDALPSGYLGVDIFFVISGFVITSSLQGLSARNLSDFLAEFYVRRIKRLLPALVFFVCVIGVLICLFNPQPASTLKTGVTALFGLSNLYLFTQSTDYFAASTKLNAFTHTWSLGVEEQFYIFFPLLVWFTGFSPLTSNGSKHLFLIITALSLTSLIGFVYLYQAHQPAAYFLLPTRIWELGAGCLLFLSLARPNRVIRVIHRFPSLLVLAALIGALFLPLQLAVPTTVAVVALTVTLIAGLHTGTTAYALLSHHSVVYIGKISYSLYLWHWGVLSLSRWTIGVEWWTVPFQIVLMLLLAGLSYRYVEISLRHADWSVRRWRSIGYGLAASTSAAAVLAVLIKNPTLLYLGRSPDLVAVGVKTLAEPYFLGPAETTWEGEKCILSDNSQVGKKISIEGCTLGNLSTAQKRVLVLGNSFGAAFTQAFDDLVVRDGYAVTIASSWGASPVVEVQNRSMWPSINKYYWHVVAPSLIASLKPGDWVFLISDLASFSPAQPSQDGNNRLRQLKDGLEILSRELSRKGIRLAVMHGIPFARDAECQPVMAMTNWFTPFGSHCKLPNKNTSLSRRKALDNTLLSLQHKNAIRIVDLFDIFCPADECTYYSADGQILYRDEFSHPSVEAARLSAPVIRTILTSADM